MGVGTTAGNAGQPVGVSGTINGVTETASYSYDDVGRLVTSSQTSNGASAQRRFVYDRWGNRTSVWDSTTGGNQIQIVTLQQSSGVPTNRLQSVTAGGTVKYTTDSAGNVTNDGLHNYTYDGANRLTSVDLGSTAQYSYDFNNRRVKRLAAGATTHFIWHGRRVLAEHDGTSGNMLVDYITFGDSTVAKVQANGAVTYL
jgi:YD repeat-containing protein